MSDPLIERVAAAVAPGYRELVGEGCAGLLMAPYFYGGAEELAPLALELTEVDAFVRRDGYQEELGWPELDAEAVALCEELTRRIESEDDGQTVLDVFWLALARHMHALLGIPVLVDEAEMPIGEQLGRQLGTVPDPDPLAGLDVLLSVRIDEHRVAAVFTGGLGGLETYAFGRVGHPGGRIRGRPEGDRDQPRPADPRGKAAGRRGRGRRSRSRGHVARGDRRQRRLAVRATAAQRARGPAVRVARRARPPVHARQGRLHLRATA